MVKFCWLSSEMSKTASLQKYNDETDTNIGGRWSLVGKNWWIRDLRDSQEDIWFVTLPGNQDFKLVTYMPWQFKPAAP